MICLWNDFFFLCSEIVCSSQCCSIQTQILTAKIYQSSSRAACRCMLERARGDVLPKMCTTIASTLLLCVFCLQFLELVNQLLFFLSFICLLMRIFALNTQSSTLFEYFCWLTILLESVCLTMFTLILF